MKKNLKKIFAVMLLTIMAFGAKSVFANSDIDFGMKKNFDVKNINERTDSTGKKVYYWEDNLAVGESELGLRVSNRTIVGWANTIDGGVTKEVGANRYIIQGDGTLAFCLEPLKAYPSDSVNQNTLSGEQKQIISAIIKLGYSDKKTTNDTKVIQNFGPLVKGMSTIDAFVVTKVAIHQAYGDFGKIKMYNDKLNSEASKLVAAAKSLATKQSTVNFMKTGQIESDSTNFYKKYSTNTSPFDGLQGEISFRLGSDVPGAKIKVSDGTMNDISSTQSVKVKVGDDFTLVVPKSSVVGKLKVVLNGSGGTVSFNTAVFGTPTAGVQNSLVIGYPIISTNEKFEDEIELDQPSIGTQATNAENGTQVIEAVNPVKIKDRVKYENLIIGKEYNIKGVLMDKDTGKPLLVNDKGVTADVKFTPTTRNGTVDVEFVFDATLLSKKKIVVFESLYESGQEVAVHKDINDENQTVTVNEKLELKTTATNAEDNGKYVDANANVTINDKVCYSGVEPNVNYILKGILMDKDTGEPLLVDGQQVTAEHPFTPTSSEGCVDMKFNFNSNNLEGKSLVVFEELWKESTDTKVGEHKDINDNDQTVLVKKPELQTTATGADGKKNLKAVKNVKVIDKVCYKGLQPNTEYQLQGVIMDRETGEPLIIDGKKVTQKINFKTTTADGCVNMEFLFNADKLENKTLVVFEELFNVDGSKKITEHKDINDEGQTVRIGDQIIVTGNDALMYASSILVIATISLIGYARLRKLN